MQAHPHVADFRPSKYLDLMGFRILFVTGLRFRAPHRSFTAKNTLHTVYEKNHKGIQMGSLSLYVALKITRGCLMTLEGSAAKYLYLLAKQKTSCTPHIYECPVPQGKDDSNI